MKRIRHMAAEHVTPEAINFMAMYGRGLIAIALTKRAFKPAADYRLWFRQQYSRRTGLV
ncbi:hypothetical protein O9992_04960 [Vibrio lentus]|nr:hypothetical protein [Vibrio lentus]